MKIKTLREYVENPPKVIQKGWTLKQYLEGPSNIYGDKLHQASAAQPTQPQSQPQQPAPTQEKPEVNGEDEKLKQIDQVLDTLIPQYQKQITDLCNKYMPAGRQNWFFGNNTTLGNYGWGGVFKRLAGGQQALHNTYGPAWNANSPAANSSVDYKGQGMSLSEYARLGEEIEKEVDFIARIVFKMDLLEEMLEGQQFLPMSQNPAPANKEDWMGKAQPAAPQQQQPQATPQQAQAQKQQQQAHALLLQGIEGLFKDFRQKASAQIRQILTSKGQENTEGEGI